MEAQVAVRLASGLLFIFGMRSILRHIASVRKELVPDGQFKQRFPGIVEFAELDHFIDAPLRTYSTGMVARLGFAVASDVEPDILLIDEVLSVGDLEFQRKCIGRIGEFLARGATLVLVSHSPESVLQLCQQVVWLEEGRVVADGPAREVVEAFVTRAISGAVRAATG